VWVRSGDTLTEKRIVTGLNDDAYVRVIKGLIPGEEVITGIIIGESKNNADNTQRSPFMPQMRRRTTTGTRSQ
jgi:HlyD family secretion protein